MQTITILRHMHFGFSYIGLIFLIMLMTPNLLWTKNKPMWLLAACILMLLYEVYWIRYFKSAKTMQDFYSSMLGVPAAGATLPVAAFFLLGVYGRNLLLIAAVIVLGIGHIGIHLEHRKEIQ